MQSLTPLHVLEKTIMERDERIMVFFLSCFVHADEIYKKKKKNENNKLLKINIFFLTMKMLIIE